MFTTEVSAGFTPAEVQAQVERILQHPLFKQSRRIPGFLRYVSNEAVMHGADWTAKERTLGVEVFGRKPDYDNGSDPIVRVTATELRKKLAQYYCEDGHANEIRIDLRPGSYLPTFRRLEFAEAPAAPALTTPVLQIGEAESLPQVAPASSARAKPAPPYLRLYALMVTALLIGLTTWNFAGEWQMRRSPLNAFWGTIAHNADHVMIVLPVIGSDDLKVPGSYARNTSVHATLSLEDTNLASRITNLLEQHGTKYELLSSSEVTLGKLRSGPVVLIGALDNAWTMRLTKNLPYTFSESPNNQVGMILERGGTGHWEVNIDQPHARINRDYGIVSRFHDSLTGTRTIVIAGISSQGTQAAGELLTSPQLQMITALAKGDEDFEVVIETEAVEGHAGPPHVVVQRTWH